MKRSMWGVLAAGAVAGMIGTAAVAENEPAAGGGEAKACYRTKCGTSVKGHKGKCGGTKVDAISVEKECTDAGGAWVTAEEAKKFADM